MVSALNPDRITDSIGKPREEFTRADIIKFIENNGIKIVNFQYAAGDGRLKTLNFVVTDRLMLDKILARGERVDGSNLFSYIDAGSSDLYVVPRYKTVYVNPFSAVPSVNILCSYYTREGSRLPSSSENVLRSAHDILRLKTGMSFEAMGELEYYVIFPKQPLYPVLPQKGYQESLPFIKMEPFRCEAMMAIAQAGGTLKYGHTEVGNISDADTGMEQHEIEFLPAPAEDAADQLIIAKWILRMLGYKYGVTISFSPKIMAGHAGSGLHIHTRLVKNGKNMMVENGSLSETARKVIAGYLRCAPSLTAFGNTVPVSYLRLVPHQEAPTNVCWGDRNRSALVRVPLGWTGGVNMMQDANPQEHESYKDAINPQTVELRAPDGSADIYLTIAGIIVAARNGLEMPDALELAQKLYVGVNIFSCGGKEVQEKLPHLPASCAESADMLLKDREIYQKEGVFSPVVIDGIVSRLQSYNDRGLSERLYGKQEEIKKLVETYLHYA